MSNKVRQRQSSPSFSLKPHIKKIVASLLFFALMGLFYELKHAYSFPIKKVTVYGIHYSDAKEIQHLLTPLVRNGFFSVEVDEIKDRLLQEPWLMNVNVRRIWPDQLCVTLTERAAIARWNKNSLLSAAGDIFTPPVKSFPVNLPQFVGPEGEQMMMLHYYSKINHTIKPLNFKLAYLELTPAYSWNMMFDRGIKVNAGYKDILTRINHFVKVYPKIVGQRANEVDYVDLRYPNGLAIRWKTVT